MPHVQMLMNRWEMWNTTYELLCVRDTYLSCCFGKALIWVFGGHYPEEVNYWALFIWISGNRYWTVVCYKGNLLSKIFIIEALLYIIIFNRLLIHWCINNHATSSNWNFIVEIFFLYSTPNNPFTIYSTINYVDI